MAEKKINLRLGLKGDKQVKKGLGGVDSKLKSLGQSAMLAAGGFFAASGLIAGFKAVISASAKQELAEKKLEAALGRTSKALLDQAKALQQVTMFGDENILEAQAMLAAFTDEEDQIAELTKATIDLAAAKGFDLVSAADLVAKSFGSSTNALTRYGIEVKGAVGSTERLEMLTGNVAKLFGGQASAQAETMAGSIEQMKNAVGDAAEAIGDLLSPVVVTFAKGIKFAAESVGGFVEKFKEFGKEVELVKMMTESEASLEKFKQSLEGMTFEELSALGEELSEKMPEGLAVIHALPEELQFVAEQLTALWEVLKTKSPTRPIIEDGEEALEILDDIALTEEELAFSRKQAAEAEAAIKKKLAKEKEKLVIQELKQAALVQGSAEDAMKAVVRAESMEAVAGYISSVLKSVPFPLNLILAAGGGAVAAGLIDKGLSSFAQGGDFVTSGPQMIMVGDNPGGRERVSVEPLSSPMNSPKGGITLNISAPLVDDTVIDHIIPAIEKAQRQNLA